MTRILLYGLVCTAAIFAYRLYKRETVRVAAHIRQKQAEKRTGAKGTLVQDPTTGEYVVRR